MWSTPAAGCIPARVKRDEVIRDAAGVQAFLDRIRDAPFIALDTETSGLDPHTDTLLLIQFGTAEHQCLVDAQSVDAPALAPIFDSARPVVMHNASFDVKMLWHRYGDRLGLSEAAIVDTLSAEQLLRNGRKSDVVMQGYSLKALAERYASMELDKTVRQGFYGIRTLDDLSDGELFYAERDVEATWKVFARQLPELERDQLLRATALEGQAQVAFAQLELAGCPFDADRWRTLVEEAKTQQGQIRQELDRHFWEVADRDLFGGTTLNYGNDDEVRDALGRLGVEVGSIRLEVLRATGHPAALALADFREQQKVVSAYGEGFLGHVHPKTGRLHPRFRASGAHTGRASCSEPNLQSIPASSRFRGCFTASEGRRVITADYAGAELRIIADFSGEPFFLAALGRDEDLHAKVASRLFGRPVSKEENPELRARAKAINFGLLYGMGARALSDQLGCRQDEAERLLRAYFAAFPRLRGYVEDASRYALERGFVASASGRKYWFTDMRREGREESDLRRIAKNMPIQGTNADMIKLAMGRMVRAFVREGVDAKLVNMVHDEVVVEASEADAERARDLVVREMMAAGAELVKSVPMTVEAQIGGAWGK